MKKEILLWRQTTTPNSENQPGSFPVDQLELKCWKGVIISVMWATSDWCPVTLLANQGNFETWNIFLSSRLKKPKTLYIHLNLSCANYCIKRRLKADMANHLKRKYSVKCSGAARLSSSLCLNLFSPPVRIFTAKQVSVIKAEHHRNLLDFCHETCCLKLMSTHQGTDGWKHKDGTEIWGCRQLIPLSLQTSCCRSQGCSAIFKDVIQIKRKCLKLIRVLDFSAQLSFGGKVPLQSSLDLFSKCSGWSLNYRGVILTVIHS